MNETIWWLLVSLLVIWLLDTWVVVALCSLRSVTLPKLVGQGDLSETAGKQALALLSTSRRQALAGVHLAHVSLWTGGIVLASRLFSLWRLPAWGTTLALLGAALVTGLWEWWLGEGVERRPVEYILRMEPSIRLLMAIFYPIYTLPLRLFTPKEGAEPVTFVTEDELKNLVDAGQQEGVLEQGERRMIYSIFELGDTLAREVMVPRIDVLALDVDTTLAEAADTLLESGYSRVPVYEETIDNVIGLLYAKDLLNAWRSEAVMDSLRALLRPAYFVPEAKPVDDLLAEMQSRRIHMAIVVDEYGGVAGIVTLEDIVEEIVGEIQDEYDESEEALYRQIAPDEYEVAGRMDIDDFNELMDVNLPADDADTLGGFLYSRMGHIPVAGERLLVGDLELTVQQVSRRRITKIRARRISPSADSPRDTNAPDDTLPASATSP